MTAKLWKRKQDGWYYTTINGKQEKLSLDYKEAREIFHKLRGQEKKAPKGRLSTTIEEVCNAWLEYTKAERAPKTYENRLSYLQSFCDFVGKKVRVHDLKGQQLDQWTLKHGWGESTRAAARRTVMGCLNWGVKRRLLLESPFWGMERGHFRRAERILTADERRRISAVATNGLADFIQFVSLTGCRPFSEAAKVTAAMIDWQDKSITFEQHKTAHKGKRRTIYLTTALLARLRQLAEQHPEGPLLRTATGREWNRPAATKAMRRIEKKAKIAKLTLYSFRHSYVTDCLAQGLTPSVIGQLVGNSARVISRFYQHLEQKKAELRAAAESVRI
jgi:integrase